MADRSSRSIGTYRILWNTVRQIPKGRVLTYNEVAQLSGFPGQARLVGYALHNLPDGSKIPWHRVINARGKISFPTGSKNYRRQLNLLQREGVVVKRDIIDLETYGWFSYLKKCYQLQ